MIPLSGEWMDATVRTFTGARFIPSFVPPLDFTPSDRTFVRTLGAQVPLAIHGGADGRSSSGDLPFVFIWSHAARRGLCIMVEWSGTWKVELAPTLVPAGSRLHDTTPWELAIRAGIWGLDLNVAVGETIRLPRIVVVGFDGRVEEATNACRRFIRRHVTPRIDDRETMPPLSFNHWFAFRDGNFDASLLKSAVGACAEAGFEYFNVDAAWFKGGFRGGIGNWETVDLKRFPGGLEPFAQHVRERGLSFGLWFEPEFAHRDSDVVRGREDWFLQGPRRSPWTTPSNLFYNDDGQDYLLMNFGVADVREYWKKKIDYVYTKLGVRWIRWDLNQQIRPFWDEGEGLGSIGQHQMGHVWGLYEFLDDVIADFPDLFIEQCASGGHRIDLGMVRRGHSFWMNDATEQTDIVRTLQQRLNLVLPGNFMNTNLCQPRHDFTDFDLFSHGAGPFGYSGRLWEAPKHDFTRLCQFIVKFKAYRHVLLGDFSHSSETTRPGFEKSTSIWADGLSELSMTFDSEARSVAVMTHGI